LATLDVNKTREYLKDFHFKPLFIEELGWDHYTARLEIPIDGRVFSLTAIAQKRGMVAYHCASLDGQCIPDYQTRRRIETQTAKSTHEHLIIYTDADKTTQIWQWVKREAGKPTSCREHTYHHHQPGDALMQKLQAIFFSLEEEEILTLPDVTGRVRAAFDVDRITKRFYDRFKAEHDAFLRFLKGIPDEDMQRWYASVMLNRLMFIYFIQKKNFLNNNADYLRSKLRESQQRGKDLFYRELLCPLFFEGFAKNEADRSDVINKLLGKVPYLNGGLFLKHQIEELYGETIQIADTAFENIFAFFEQYQWHLDERPLREDNEINPDVLGYIFEKYINQKQMGAYYTKEDITEYISKNTIIPFLFDRAKQKCRIAFEGDHAIWQLLQADPDRYIYDAMKKGTELPLPAEIAVGLKDVSKRTGWNKAALSDYALPTEIWREVIARRNRYEEVWNKLADGESRDINDLITYNLNIRQFAQDVIENSEGPELLRAFWHGIESVTILDPTCGSGAFLFAALNILEPLYEACLNRMEVFLDELERSGEKHRPEKFSDFRKILQRVAQHPNPRYFIMKSIILNNLYGVDIMEEAIEICKLRLFLKLVAQVERVENIEPLPDIDFNIRAGNTLVGFVSLDDVKKAMEGDMIKLLSLPDIEEKAEIADRAFNKFREMQTEQGMKAKEFTEAKNELTKRRKTLEDELNRYLATEYGIDPKNIRNQKTYEAKFNDWHTSHKPFHWFIEFYGIIKNGGFDVIIGNPPYVEYSKIRSDYTIKCGHYITESTNNLYSLIVERSTNLFKKIGSLGLILPLSAFCTQRMVPLIQLVKDVDASKWISHFGWRPSKLFEGVNIPLSILFIKAGPQIINTTTFIKWYSEYRPALFSNIGYVAANDYIFFSHVIPKIGYQIELSILSELFSNEHSIASYRNNHGMTGEKLFYRNTGGLYWRIFTDFQPFFSQDECQMTSSTESTIEFPDKVLLSIIIGILNSNLYWFFYVLFSSFHHVNPSDILEFPIDLENIAPKDKEALIAAAHRLMKDMKLRSKIRQRIHKGGHISKMQTFYPSLSKELNDEIDRILKNHYNFSDQEHDYIVNYDIKYRMAAEMEDE
jgi:hypothetical protein